MIKSDISGMAETNTAWQHYHLRADYNQKARKHFIMVRTAFSSPTHKIDPISEHKSFQAGGTITMATCNLVPLSHGPTLLDPTGLGRWSGLHFRGKAHRVFTVLTVYRVCGNSINSASLGSSFAREYEHFRQQGAKSPRPRKILLQDLASFI